MELNEWLEQYKNDESLREFFDEKKWSNILGRIDEKEEIAKNMLLENTEFDYISEITELSIEEIKNLQNQD